MYLSIYPPGPDGGHGGGDGARRHQHAAEAADGRGRLRRATGARRPAGAAGAQKQVVMSPRMCICAAPQKRVPLGSSSRLSDYLPPPPFCNLATFL
eukprot:scaffold55326_cov102-Phaeocystis_antarctica.AAC.1